MAGAIAAAHYVRFPPPPSIEEKGRQLIDNLCRSAASLLSMAYPSFVSPFFPPSTGRVSWEVRSTSRVWAQVSTIAVWDEDWDYQPNPGTVDGHHDA